MSLRITKSNLFYQCIVQYLLARTHACNGTDVVCDGDQCRFSEVFPGYFFSTLLRYHHAKTGDSCK